MVPDWFFLCIFTHLQVNLAVQADHTQQRWVNLGNLSAACITRPGTCGPKGAAVAFWMKVIGLHSCAGKSFIASRKDYSSTGFLFRSGDDFVLQ